MRLFLLGSTLFLSACVAEPRIPDRTLPPPSPEVFLPGIVSTELSERDGSFTPDGNAFYFTVWTGRSGMIVSTEKSLDSWSTPTTATFSGRYSDLEAAISPNGGSLFFASNRPAPPDTAAGSYGIWVVLATDDGWTDPSPIGAPVDTVGNEFYPSVATDGTLYFTARRSGGQGGEDIWFSSFVDGEYQSPKNLGAAVNSERDEFNAFIAPDQSYLLFSSFGREDGFGGGDLYVSYRNEDGSWTDAVNLGPSINSNALDYCPSVGPNGSTFLFSSRRTRLNVVADSARSYQGLTNALRSTENGLGDIYWMDSNFLRR